MLDLRRTLILLVLLPACCLPAYSRRPDSFWGKIVNMISAPSMELDPAAVYQPAPCWNVAVSGELHKAGITQDNTVDFIYTYDESDGGGTFNMQALTSTRLRGGLDKVIGPMKLGAQWCNRTGFSVALSVGFDF